MKAWDFILAICNDTFGWWVINHQYVLFSFPINECVTMTASCCLWFLDKIPFCKKMVHLKRFVDMLVYSCFLFPLWNFVYYQKFLATVTLSFYEGKHQWIFFSANCGHWWRKIWMGDFDFHLPILQKHIVLFMHESWMF